MSNHTGSNPGALYVLMVIWGAIAASGLWVGGKLEDNGISFRDLSDGLYSVVYNDQRTYDVALQEGATKANLDYNLFDEYVFYYTVAQNKNEPFNARKVKEIKEDFSVRTYRLTDDADVYYVNKGITPSVDDVFLWIDRLHQSMGNIWLGFCFISFMIAGVRITSARVARGESPLQEL